MIYFDNASTSSPIGEALEEYVKVSKLSYGNPSSRHKKGYEAKKVLEEARTNILSLLGLKGSHRLVFTEGATESNNLALKGIAHHYKNRGNKIISSPVEHPSILNPLTELEKEGFIIDLLPVNEDGFVDPTTLEEHMDDKTILVSLMGVNNELGSISPLKEYASIIHRYKKAFFHSDITQALGKVDIPFEDIDLLSYSSHKFGGLKGNGGLLLKKSILLDPIMLGGEQEDGFRAGTVDVAGASSSYMALNIAMKDMKKNLDKVASIHDYILNGIKDMEGIEMNSSLKGSPYILNFSLLKKKASVVVEALSNAEICVSSVSACSSKEEPFSYVIESLGKNESLAKNSIRLSFSGSNTLEEAQVFLNEFKRIMLEVVDR